MRKLVAPLAAAFLLATLGACANTSATTASFASTGATIVGSITNDIAMACQSANAVLSAANSEAGLAAAAQAGTPAKTVVAKASSLNNTIQAYCTLGQIAGSALSTALAAVNTSAANVLSTGAAPPAIVSAAGG